MQTPRATAQGEEDAVLHQCKLGMASLVAFHYSSNCLAAETRKCSHAFPAG